MDTPAIGRRHAWLVGLGWYLLPYIPLAILLRLGALSGMKEQALVVLLLIMFIGSVGNAIYQGVQFWKTYGRAA